MTSIRNRAILAGTKVLHESLKGYEACSSEAEQVDADPMYFSGEAEAVFDAIISVLMEPSDEMLHAGWVASRLAAPFCKREVSQQSWTAMLTQAKDG